MNAQIDLVGPQEFYERLLAAVRSARYQIDLTHLSPSLPLCSEFVTYEDQVNKIIKHGTHNKPHIPVRRIVAIESTDKLDWVLTSLEAGKYRTNFSLALVHSSLKILRKRYFPLPANVQVIDSKTVYHVDPVHGINLPDEQGGQSAIVSHGGYATIMTKYYDEWFRLCHPLKHGDKIDYDRLDELNAEVHKSESASDLANRERVRITIEKLRSL